MACFIVRNTTVLVYPYLPGLVVPRLVFRQRVNPILPTKVDVSGVTIFPSPMPNSSERTRRGTAPPLSGAQLHNLPPPPPSIITTPVNMLH